MNYRKSLLAALLAPLVSICGGAPGPVHAAGFAIFTQGATALGQGNAVTAHTDDASSIFYNPALINKLDGTQLSLGTTAIFSSRKFDSNPGGNPTSDDTTFFPSTFFATHKFNDRLSAGLGVFNPFGLGTEWNDNWDGRFQATKSKLTVFDINPVVSYRVLPSLAVAVGLDVMLVDASLERKVPAGAFGAAGPATETGLKFKGDGTGVGFNVGVAYDPCKHVSLGASYRSQVFVGIHGSSSTSPAFSIPPDGTLTPLDGDGKANIRLPQQVTAGIAYQVIDPLVIEAGVRWEGWSSFKELQIGLDNGSNLVTPRDWHDVWGLNVGGKYRLNDTVALSAGYVYGNSSVPDATFDPSIPDAATHVFCLGTDLSFQRFKLALSYAYQLYENRTKNNDIGFLVPPPSAFDSTAANGTYKSDAHLVAVSLGYKF